MTDPIQNEPFLLRPAPRCLARPQASTTEAVVLSSSRLSGCAPWPVRASLERWARSLLQLRSGGQG